MSWIRRIVLRDVPVFKMGFELIGGLSISWESWRYD